MPPAPEHYADIVKRTTGHLGCGIILEPGRLIVGNAGVLVTRVLYVKKATAKTFVIVDAAMNDLIRPTLYEAYHGILPVVAPDADAPVAPVDLVGPVCETGDFIAQDRPLTPLGPQDLVAVLSAGAYGAVMASTYNTRPLIPEVLVHGDAFAVVRERVPVEKIIGLDSLPPWITGLTWPRPKAPCNGGLPRPGWCWRRKPCCRPCCRVLGSSGCFWRWPLPAPSISCPGRCMPWRSGPSAWP